MLFAVKLELVLRWIIDKRYLYYYDFRHLHDFANIVSEAVAYWFSIKKVFLLRIYQNSQECSELITIFLSYWYFKTYPQQT